MSWPRQFPRMVLAELRLVFGRPSGWAALGMATFIGLLAALGLHYVAGMGDEAQLNGQMLSSLVQGSGTRAASWALNARNFFVMPILLLLCTAACVAGELHDRTLREELVRPVTRASVLLAKLTALMTLSLATLALTWATSVSTGTAFYGAGDGLWPVTQGYLASWACDLGIVSLGVLLSVLIRNVGGVIVGVVLFRMADLALWAGAKFLSAIGVNGAARVADMLPANALDAWQGWEAGFAPEPFLGLAGLVLIAGGLAFARFQAMDVP